MMERTGRRLHHIYWAALGREQAKRMNGLFEEEAAFLFEEYRGEGLAQIQRVLTRLSQRKEKSPFRGEEQERGVNRWSI